MNKRQKKKMAKKMREKAKKPVGIGTEVKMLCDAVGIFTKMLCDAMGVFNDAMAAYTGETKTFTELLTNQRAIGRRKKRIMVSRRSR